MQPDVSDLPWRTSSFSGNGASCVEVAITETVIKVRDTKDRAGGTLTFRPDEWEAFLAGVRHGEFELVKSPDPR
ncbi:DUF397 domain-containing protein [Nonomuraea basaltis]|uniref:DUF397 domain-containing protein n=1 Tax=Nonomuraea basaltis TaxID=2495887 RepID=UPI00110C3FFF|nr:DUF397 domain-containing protein [Nonomuraea basaltis]TMR99777.1 DUF397 domain-containing protein [Nonomuraea basaltis]